MSEANKRVVLVSDFAGYPLKAQVIRHLQTRGWQITDLSPDPEDQPMYHRAGLMIGAKLAEGEFPKGLAFCGSGMGIHVAASKCPHVHAAVSETVHAAKRAVAANNCNLLAMGAFWTGPRLGRAMADAFLETNFGDGYEDWEGFYDYHMAGYLETENFDYEAFKAAGFQFDPVSDPVLGPEPASLAF